MSQCQIKSQKILGQFLISCTTDYQLHKYKVLYRDALCNDFSNQINQQPGKFTPNRQCRVAFRFRNEGKKQVFFTTGPYISETVHVGRKRSSFLESAGST